jgi:putative endonuclease
MSDFRKSLGVLGEDLAVAALQRRGIQVCVRNWRCPLGEIDIVAWEGDVLAIIEVKTRRGRSAGTPEQGVDMRKQRKLCALAQCYVENIGWEGEVRIDVVGIELSPEGKLLRVSYWRGAIECL